MQTSGLWLAAILVAGTALRAIASSGDLWLDEIWSIDLAQAASGPLAALTIPHDNSHPLNTLLLRALGDAAPQLIYRLLSLASGVLAIALAAAIGTTRGRTGACIAAGVIALSFPMLVYSSEARGYMTAVAAALAAYLLARRALTEPRWTTVAAFWLASVAGLLGHYSFLQVLLAIGIWSAWATLRGQADRASGMRTLVRMHAVPLVVVAILAVTVLARMRTGGGPKLPLATLFGETLGWALGLPTNPVGLLVGAVVVLLVVAAEIIALRRERDDTWLFLLLMVVVLPALIALLRPPLLYPRYFLLNVTFLLLALSSVVTRLLDRGGIARMAAIALIAAFCAGNAMRDVRFLRDGRGAYRSALAFMAADRPGHTITVTGSDDFAIRRELAFHGKPFAAAGTTFVYRPLRTAPRGAEWLIVRRGEHDPEPDAKIEDAFRNRYALARRFPSYGPSGADWYVYDRRP